MCGLVRTQALCYVLFVTAKTNVNMPRATCNAAYQSRFKSKAEWTVFVEEEVRHFEPTKSFKRFLANEEIFWANSELDVVEYYQLLGYEVARVNEREITIKRDDLGIPHATLRRVEDGEHEYRWDDRDLFEVREIERSRLFNQGKVVWNSICERFADADARWSEWERLQEEDTDMRFWAMSADFSDKAAEPRSNGYIALSVMVPMTQKYEGGEFFL